MFISAIINAAVILSIGDAVRMDRVLVGEPDHRSLVHGGLRLELQASHSQQFNELDYIHLGIRFFAKLSELVVLRTCLEEAGTERFADPFLLQDKATPGHFQVLSVLSPFFNFFLKFVIILDVVVVSLPDRVELVDHVSFVLIGFEALSETGPGSLDESDKSSKQTQVHANALNRVRLLLNARVPQQLDSVARRLARVLRIFLNVFLGIARILVHVDGVVVVDALLGLPQNRLENPVVIHGDDVLSKRVLVTNVLADIHDLGGAGPESMQVLLVHLVGGVGVVVVFHGEELVLEDDLDLKVFQVLLEVFLRRALTLVGHEIVLGGDGRARVEHDKDAGTNVIQL